MGVLKFCRSIKRYVSDITPFQVAAFIRDSRSFGATVPGKRWSALKWVEGVLDVTLHCINVTVKAQSIVVDEYGLKSIPTPAKCPDEAWVKMMEMVVMDSARGVVTRIYAGALVAMTLGVLRWSDLQRNFSLKLGADALMGMAQMKARSTLQSWVAPRLGLNGRDWALPWITLLTEQGMPGKDFLLFRPKGDLSGFSAKPAEHADMTNMLRVIVMKAPFSMTADEAVEWTPHGPRHFIPSVARNLGMSDEIVNCLGHWVKGSTMPERYDVMANTVEMVNKAKIMACFQTGLWSQTKEGENPIPMPSDEDLKKAGWLPPVAPQSEKMKEAAVKLNSIAFNAVVRNPTVNAEGELVVTPLINMEKPIHAEIEEPKRVFNKRYGTVHVWIRGERALCGWHSGSAKAPKEFSVFLDSLTEVAPECRNGRCKALCAKCYSQRHLACVPVAKRLQSMEEMINEVDCLSADSDGAESSCTETVDEETVEEEVLVILPDEEL